MGHKRIALFTFYAPLFSRGDLVKLWQRLGVRCSIKSVEVRGEALVHL
jgi:hypothetical protein